MRRGARTAHPLSRKWRLSSPTTVCVAYVENSRPRSGSKRSTALTNPIDATWTRSSSGSPRLAKRRARYSASPRWASISSALRRSSRDCANAVNFSRSSCLRWGSWLMRRSASPGAELQHAEPRPAVVDRELVLVGHGVEDQLGQLAQPGGRTRVEELSGSPHFEPLRLEPVRHADVPFAALRPDEPEDELVDGDAKVVDLVDREGQAAGQPHRRHPSQPQELGVGRHDELDLV